MSPLEEQGSSAAIGLSLRIEDVRLPEREVKRVRTERALVQQVAQVRGRRRSVRERQQHEHSLYSRLRVLDAPPLQAGPTRRQVEHEAGSVTAHCTPALQSQCARHHSHSINQG